MTEESGRKIILNFLKKYKDNKYTVTSLFRALKEEYPDLGLSHYKVAIMTEHLIASNQIECLDFGYKVVWYEDKNK